MDMNLLKINNSTHAGKTFEFLDKKTIMKVLFTGATLLELLNVKYWMSAGTALGLYRNNEVIPHDTDIDVEIVLNYNKPTKEIENKINMAFEENGFVWNRRMWYDGRIMQLAYVKKNVIFDIYFMYSGIEKDNLVNYNDHGKYVIPKKFVNTLYEHMDLPFPHPTAEYLAYRYGDDWTIPKTEKDSWEDDCKCLQKILL